MLLPWWLMLRASPCLALPRLALLCLVCSDSSGSSDSSKASHLNMVKGSSKFLNSLKNFRTEAKRMLVTNLILGAKASPKKGDDKNTKNPNSKYEPIMLSVPVFGPILDAKKTGFRGQFRNRNTYPKQDPRYMCLVSRGPVLVSKYEPCSGPRTGPAIVPVFNHNCAQITTSTVGSCFGVGIFRCFFVPRFGSQD